MNFHLYTVPSQPATRFVDRSMARPIWFRCDPRRLWWTDCCGQRRWAKYVRVQVYYDGVRRWCADGHGCQEARHGAK